MSLISDNLQAVCRAIAIAEKSAGRSPGAVRLLAVSKTCSAEILLEAITAGQTAFGENYLQEALDKMEKLRELMQLTQLGQRPLEWHFIGPIQSNKTRPIAEHFDWVHSVDRLKIAQRLSEQRPAHMPPLNICLQVNISEENSKSGISPEQLETLAHAVAALPNLRLRGLMAIPAPADTEAQQRMPLRQMREWFERLRSQGLEMDTLSMGMSADMNVAIAEGSTMVRVGTAIFGARNLG